MKRSNSISVLAALPLFAFSPLPGGQYRGPEYEALSVSGQAKKAGSQNKLAGATLAPTLADSFGSWEFWFEWNKDVMMRSRRADSVEVLGDQLGMLLGADRIEAHTVYGEILPALEQAIARNEAELVKTCLFALGKTGESDAFAILEKSLDRGDLETRCVAALSLGQLEDRESLARLAGLFFDSNVPTKIRAHAALGLGMRGEPEAAALLREFLDKKLNLASLESELAPVVLASLRAIGLCRDAQAAPFLIRKFDSLDRAGHSKARAALCAILSSLGRLGDASALGTLVAAMQGKDAELRRAAALALGDLGETGAIPPLAASLHEDADTQTRGFAAISLGRIGGQAAREILRQEFSQTKHRSVREYSALALGLSGDIDSVEAIRALLASKEMETTRSAAAIALGFLADGASADELLAIVENRAEPAKLRGYAALAAGLTRSEIALPRLLAQLRKNDERLEELQRGLLLGLGLLRDPAATEDLLRVIGEEKRDVLRGHAALALGLIRDKKAVSPLVEMLAGKRRVSPESRAFAGVALGALGDRYNYPRVAELFFNTNYRVRNEMIDRAAMFF